MMGMGRRVGGAVGFMSVVSDTKTLLCRCLLHGHLRFSLRVEVNESRGFLEDGLPPSLLIQFCLFYNLVSQEISNVVFMLSSPFDKMPYLLQFRGQLLLRMGQLFQQVVPYD